MTVVISTSLILSPDDGFDEDNPVIGWENLVTPASVTAGATADNSAVADASYPIANLANTSTYQRFQQDTGGESFWIEIDLDGSQDVDYVAVAGHNFGSKQRAVRVWGALSVDSNGDPEFAAVTQEIIPGNDTPLLFRFTPAPYIALRLYVVSSTSLTSDIAYASVLYAGKLLVLERKIQVSFTPLPYGRRSDVISNRSERGHFLGRTIVGAWVESSATFQYLSPDWYREYMDDFLDAAQTEPFFFAWAPVSYPREVGFAWLMEDAEPQIHVAGPTGYMQVTLNMQGIVE